jgi:4a-hydroxytetrahydrobiopterin dehydratase
VAGVAELEIGFVFEEAGAGERVDEVALDVGDGELTGEVEERLAEIQLGGLAVEELEELDEGRGHDEGGVGVTIGVADHQPRTVGDRTRHEVEIHAEAGQEIGHVPLSSRKCEGGGDGLVATLGVMAAKLTQQEVTNALGKLPGWVVKDGKLHREYRFSDFIHAFGFMATCATYIQARDHHPEWSNVWNRVTVDLTTHDAQGITAKDVDLAQFMERVAAKLA